MLSVGVFTFVLFAVFVIGFRTNGQSVITETDQANSQTLVILSLDGAPHLTDGTGGGDIETDNGALVPYGGSNGVVGDQLYVPSAEQISLYVVQEGDTLGHIAELFDVSTNTIRWANDIGRNNVIQPGEVLTILPISSVRHTVESGETLASIVKNYDGDLYETALYNNLEETAMLAVGDIVLIPDGVSGQSDEHYHGTNNSDTGSSPTSSDPSTQGSGYFIRAWGGVRTQGFHGPWRAVDYGMPVGSPVGASAAGTVIAAKSPTAWNGGYGGLIVLQHNNGAQTLYAHLSQLQVSVGQTVQQSEVVGLSGNTGRSTGPHLHFEIRNWGDVGF
jgi:murein DD-endopeptidase MepM/ murein hydrolase activator NlpD